MASWSERLIAFIIAAAFLETGDIFLVYHNRLAAATGGGIIEWNSFRSVRVFFVPLEQTEFL